MGHKLKTLVTALCIIAAVMWHHQATLFQRHVRENISLLHAYAGPTLQLGDIIISKYLFKVEFKKPQLDINNQSLEKMKEDLPKDAGFISKFIQKQLSALPPTFRLNYRVADRLVLSYNPFWHELTISSVGDGELSLQTTAEKIDLLAPDHNDLNQGKIKISLPAPGWVQKIKKFFFKDTVNVINVNSNCRNVKIVTAANQEVLYTQDYSLLKLNINEESFEGKQHYTFTLDLQSDNAYFSPTLAKMWPFLESYVLGGKSKKQSTYKVRIDSEEGKTFVNLLLSHLQLNQNVDWQSAARTIPTIKVEAKNSCKNDAISFSNDTQFDYQPQKNYLKTSCESTFQAHSAWPAYLEKLCAFYQSVAAYVQDHSKAVSNPAANPLWYSLLANLKEKGEIKSGFMLELKDMHSDKFQVQGSLKIGLEKSGFAIRGDYKAPALKVDVDFEDHETFLNKLYSYILNNLEGQTRKAAEILLPTVKNNLIENIQKLSVTKNEEEPHVRTVPIQFNSETQALEIAGKTTHHEFLDTIKMVLNTLSWHSFVDFFSVNHRGGW